MTTTNLTTPLIFHLTTPEQWQQAQEVGIYRVDSLESEGFIHASTIHQVISVANAFYRSQPELILLCLDLDRLTAEIRWEAPVHPSDHPSSTGVNAIAETAVFPHIYGAINLDAVQEAIVLTKDETGAFFLPPDYLRLGKIPNAP
jgi:uncharacterized protein (DUF952 family)